MKSLFLGVMVLAFGLTAGAACKDRWGHQVYLRKMQGNVVSLSFDTYLYPASGHLSYNGQRSTSYYFRGNGNTAEIEKTVFSNGQGRIWFHYIEDGDKRTRRMATFVCH